VFIRNIEEISPPVKTYSCGSPPLKDFLEKNGIVPIYKYTHNISKRTIWIFVECDDLSKCLTMWSNNRPMKEEGGEV